MSLEIVGDPGAWCSMTRQFTFRLTWKAERQYVPGTQVELRSHCLRAFLSWRYVRLEVSPGDLVFRWKSNPTVSELRQNMARVILRARLQYGLRQGDALEFRLTVIPPVWADLHNELSLWTVDMPSNFDPSAPAPAARREEGSICCLVAAAGPVERLSVVSRPMPGARGTVRTCLVPEDRFGNPSTFSRPVPVRLRWEGAERLLELRERRILELEAPRDVGRALLAVPTEALAPSENVANGFRDGRELVVRGNPVWRLGPEGLTAAFGEMHWHTDFSGDGERDIEKAVCSARDDLNMDFCAPGDHNPKGEQWSRTVAALEAANVAGEFATFFGWENGTDRGHENYYFTDPAHPLVCGGTAGISGGHPADLAERLERLAAEHEFIAIPHHTNAVAATRRIEDDSPFWHPYPWAAPRAHVRLVEIMQIRGNQERDVYDDAWRGWHQGNGSSVQDALALGHRIGFTGGTDNHSGWPGRVSPDSEGKGMYGPGGVILTGVWTKAVERNAVFGALKSRRTWAVWDTRALVWLTVGGAKAGDVLEVSPSADLVARIRLSAQDALQTVEIVSEGRVVWQRSFDELDLDLEVPLGRADHPTHFYLRALQRDGGIIYASPVFVEPG